MIAWLKKLFRGCDHALTDNGGEFGCLQISCSKCGVEVGWFNLFAPYADSDGGTHASAHHAHVWLKRKIQAFVPPQTTETAND